MKERIKNSKFRGFTLIELIVVIAIIAVLACILVPSMMGYHRQAKSMELIANARNVYSGACTALLDNCNSGREVRPGEIYIGDDSGTAVAVNGSDSLSVGRFMGEDFKGHYAFIIADNGFSVECAVWCDKFPIEASEAHMYTMEEIEESISGKGIGCYPYTYS